MKLTRYAVIGIRNFAKTYIENLIKLEREGSVALTAVVVTDIEKNQIRTEELRQKGIHIFCSFDELLAEGKDKIDVIILSTSIYSHGELAEKALQNGFNVLLEKPPVPTIDELDCLIEIEKSSKGFCSIGFQFHYSTTIRTLKDMVVSGRLGRILEISCKGYWPRYRSYYNRNAWAGKTFFNGRIILDGPITNGFSHYLNIMLYLASDKENCSAQVKTVRAELYRAHSYIQCDDTSCLELETSEGTIIRFYVTHAPSGTSNPYMELTTTEARIRWWYDNERTEIDFNNGRKEMYNNTGVDPWLNVLRITAKVDQGLLPTPYSTLENSRAFIVAVNGAYESARQIITIPSNHVSEFFNNEGEYMTVLQDIERNMDEAFEKKVLLSDLSIPWAIKTETVCMNDYTTFNPFLQRLK